MKENWLRDRRPRQSTRDKRPARGKIDAASIHTQSHSRPPRTLSQATLPPAYDFELEEKVPLDERREINTYCWQQ